VRGGGRRLLYVQEEGGIFPRKSVFFQRRCVKEKEIAPRFGRRGRGEKEKGVLSSAIGGDVLLSEWGLKKKIRSSAKGGKILFPCEETGKRGVRL